LKTVKTTSGDSQEVLPKKFSARSDKIKG